MTVNLVREPEDEQLAQPRVDEHGDLHGELAAARPARCAAWCWRPGTDGPPRGDAAPPRSSGCTTRPSPSGRRGWRSRRTRGRWRETLHRSAITLKLMTYAPTGGLVAAPDGRAARSRSAASATGTTATPGSGTPRSRSTPCSGLGFTEEAAAFARLAAATGCSEQAGSGAAPLKIMYRVDGSSDLTEEILEHWEGYRGSTPGADRQRRRRPAAARHLRRGDGQHLLRRPARAARCRTRAGAGIADMLDWLVDNWDQPEEGIWETRGGRKDFTYGRLMCWVALDRGVRHGHSARTARSARDGGATRATRSTTRS